MEEKLTIEEIIERLNDSIKSGLYFEIRSVDSKTLMEYIDSQNKQIGIEKTMSGMKQNNINTLAGHLENAERQIKELQDRLNATKLKQLEDEERALDLELVNKKYQIEQYSKTIDKLEYEIEELNSKLNIIY